MMLELGQECSTDIETLRFLLLLSGVRRHGEMRVVGCSVRNREVLLEGSLILRRGGVNARGSRDPDSGPIPDPLASL